MHGVYLSRIWNMTAAEIAECISAAENRSRIIMSMLYKSGEAAAFNTAALCMTAFNAPQKFPKTMQEAFVSSGSPCGTSEDFAEIARCINERNMNGG